MSPMILIPRACAYSSRSSHSRWNSNCRRRCASIAWRRRVGAVGLGPLLPGLLAQELLTRAEDRIRREPVVVLVTEPQVLRFVANALEARERGRRGQLQKAYVSRKGAEARIRRAKAVRGVDGQDLPVLLSACGEPVHEAARRGAERAGPAAVGHGGDVAEHAHAALERGLQAPLVVEVQHRGAERPEEDLGLTVAHARNLAGDHVGDLLVAHGHLDGVRLGETGVHEHAHALVLAAPPEAKDVLAGREGLELAVHHELGQRLAHGNRVAVDVGAVAVTAVPGEARAIVRITEALDAALVAVVDARDAGQGHLQQRHDPQPRLREAHLVVGETRSSSGTVSGSGAPPSTVNRRSRSWLPSRLSAE